MVLEVFVPKPELWFVGACTHTRSRTHGRGPAHNMGRGGSRSVGDVSALTGMARKSCVYIYTFHPHTHTDSLARDLLLSSMQVYASTEAAAVIMQNPGSHGAADSRVCGCCS